jgi:uncharacterized protein
MSELSDFYTGAPLEPSDLRYREDFIAQLWETLDRQHGLLTAPRRTGKTSVMDYLAAHPARNFSVVPVFVQDLDHPGEFILTLLDAFRDRHPGFFRDIFAAGSRGIAAVLKRIADIEAGGFKVALREQDPAWKTNWKARGDSFLEQVRASGRRVLFIVDEFPDMILNMQKHHADLVRPFLGWFRGHRQKPRPKVDPVRWLLGGSVNLSSTLDALGCLDEINDLHDEHLPFLSAPQIEDFVHRMLDSRGVGMVDGFAAEVAARLGRPIPLFMQMLTQDLYRLWKRRPPPREPLTSGDITAALEDLIVSSAARDKLQHYYSRIEQYYDEPKRSAAYEMLNQLSLAPKGLTRARLLAIFEGVLTGRGDRWAEPERRRRFNQLLRDLENDFYVAETARGRLDFASGLLKAWWRKYYA